MKASLSARLTTLASNSARGAFLGRTLRSRSLTDVVAGTKTASCFSLVMFVLPSVSGERVHLEVLDDRPEREPGEVSQSSDDQHDADQQRSEGRAIGREGPRRDRDAGFFRQRSGHGQ